MSILVMQGTLLIECFDDIKPNKFRHNEPDLIYIYIYIIYIYILYIYRTMISHTFNKRLLHMTAYSLARTNSNFLYYQMNW